MKNILEVLSERYKKSTLTKLELANELGVSMSTIDKALAKGNILPQYIKLGNGDKVTLRFNIVAVANFLSNDMNKMDKGVTV